MIMVKAISVLGCTGSIGRQTLAAAEHIGMRVAALTAQRQIELLEQQARRFHPSFVAVYDEEAAKRFKLAVADTDIIDLITPEFLAARLDDLNQSAAVVADANLSEASLCYLLDHCTAPLMVDAVSTTKASRIVEALQRSACHRLHTLKLNLKEALAVTHCETASAAATALTVLGVEHVYITLGAGGVFCCSGDTQIHYPATAVDVVNTTGAGDAFLAGVAHAFVRQAPFPRTALYGQEAARVTLLTTEAVNPDIAKIVL
jgi:pseudouridine kinase